MGAGDFLGLYIGVILLAMIIAVIFWIVVSLIFRSYVMWYFKINKRLRQQEEMYRMLSEKLSKVISLLYSRQAD
ncbi:MAG: hypothetical protein HDT08_03125 [Bacteroidales bacterium]|nr:hypothetical protein [Bacteroidales bacterium]MBD5241802.1 hypothetical protein [Barnesiella sp.]MDE5821882.1 hypothetical protein [Paramuribaculum sp.]